MVYFGKLKGTEDEWGFDNFESSFETFIETDEETNIKIIQQANEEQKIIKATGKHTWNKGVKSADGKKIVYKCSVCQKTKTEDVPQNTTPSTPASFKNAKRSLVLSNIADQPTSAI